LIVWHGHTWHGAFERTTPGLRVNLIYFFCRCYLKTSEAYGDNVPQEVLDRNPERFARLMGKYTSSGWKSEGPDYDKWEYLHRSALTVHS
jgi:ectoine hydroxylase-related dioxygenase (phytanoyl-CoA dioxygenase family)